MGIQEVGGLGKKDPGSHKGLDSYGLFASMPIFRYNLPLNLKLGTQLIGTLFYSGVLVL